MPPLPVVFQRFAESTAFSDLGNFIEMSLVAMTQWLLLLESALLSGLQIKKFLKRRELLPISVPSCKDLCLNLSPPRAWLMEYRQHV